jgi:hypothetical protein
MSTLATGTTPGLQYRREIDFEVHFTEFERHELLYCACVPPAAHVEPELGVLSKRLLSVMPCGGLPAFLATDIEKFENRRLSTLKFRPRIRFNARSPTGPYLTTPTARRTCARCRLDAPRHSAKARSLDRYTADRHLDRTREALRLFLWSAITRYSSARCAENFSLPASRGRNRRSSRRFSRRGPSR